jgi:hypothetical protein
MTWHVYEFLCFEALARRDAGELTYDEAYNMRMAHLEGTCPGYLVELGVMVAVVIWAWYSGSALPDTVFGWFKLHLNVWLVQTPSECLADYLLGV